VPPVCAARQAQLAEPARLELLVRPAPKARQAQRVLLVRPAQLAPPARLAPKARRESLAQRAQRAQLEHKAQRESLAQLEQLEQLEHKAPPAQPGQPELKVRLDLSVRLVRQEPRVRWAPLALKVQQVRQELRDPQVRRVQQARPVNSPSADRAATKTAPPPWSGHCVGKSKDRELPSNA
jgi:hypothetical protein